MIRFEIDNAVFGIADARRHLIGVDPQAQAALTMFGEAQKLTELSKGAKKANRQGRSLGRPSPLGAATPTWGCSLLLPL